MANTSTTTTTLYWTNNYADADTRKVSLSNPLNTLAQNVENTRTKINTFGALTVGDKNGAAFTSSSNCYIEEKTVTKLDLSRL